MLKSFLLRSTTIHRVRLLVANVKISFRKMFSGDVERTQRDLEILRGDILRLTFNPTSKLTIKTDHPVAYESDDHHFPMGTMYNNTRSPRFVRACELLFKKKLTVLDLGCAGGGLVLDFLLNGHDAYGVEGSDFSRKSARAEWRTIPNHLFTADIAKPFTVTNIADSSPSKVDLITAWEVLEHLDENELKGLFSNIRNNLSRDGLFMGSVACFESRDPIKGAVYHKTVRPQEWWAKLVEQQGFEIIETPLTSKDFPRGPDVDWDAKRHPEYGFHLVCRPKDTL